MNKAYIINIVGIQGSGKSYICNKLKHLNIPCIDTDKVLSDTFFKLLKSNKTFQKYLTKPDKNNPENIPDNASNILFKEAEKYLKNEIQKVFKKNKNKTPLIIVVGITIPTNSDLKFFIKLNNKELERAYKRVMIRELDKIKSNYNNLVEIINKKNINFIASIFLMKYEIGAISSTIPFAGYKKMYEGLNKSEKKQKTLIKTQNQIIKHIEKLYSEK